MASLGMQMLASALCLLGWAGVIFNCLLPMWKVTAFVGTTIITSQTTWVGIWMTCVAVSTGQIQCKPYESLLALTSDLQAARALTVLAITMGGLGLVLAFIGGKCTRFLDDVEDGAKGKVAIAAGAVLIATGVICLIPTSWAAGTVVENFYTASIDTQQSELGACLYIGWGASLLLILGGGLFIYSARPFNTHDTNKSPSVRYVMVRSSNGGSTAGSYHSRVPTSPNPPFLVLPRTAQGQERATPMSLLYTRPPWEVQFDRYLSERSWAPSTKSQMKREESIRSELSEKSLTKSQLQKAEIETMSVASETHDPHLKLPKTYL